MSEGKVQVVIRQISNPNRSAHVFRGRLDAVPREGEHVMHGEVRYIVRDVVHGIWMSMGEPCQEVTLIVTEDHG